MANLLIEHAERELRRAGLFDADSDYEGALGKAVMDLVKVHAEQGHSGFSNAMVVSLFSKCANYKVLSPITSDPDEWNDVGDKTRPMWQSNRQPSVFSDDGGKTWYDIDKGEKSAR